MCPKYLHILFLQLKEGKSKPESSPPDDAVTVQISQFETAKQLEMDREIEKVIKKLQREGKIHQTMEVVSFKNI